MEKLFIIGVVISKKKLTFCLISQDKILKKGEIANESTAIRLTISLLLQEFDLSNEQILICAEHTGQFNYPLIYTCESEKYTLWLENPTRIKFYCTGLQQRKDYRLNSKQIAVYASRNVNKTTMYRQPESELENLKQLYQELNMLEVDSDKMHSKLVEQKNYMSEEVFNDNAKRLIILLKGLHEAIKSVENEINRIFANNSFLARQLELLTSIEGVDSKIALKMMVETDAFTRYENCRQFCSHIGIAPIHKLTDNPHKALNVNSKFDKGIKTLLNLTALSIVKKNDSELKNYFVRKVKEGKDEKVVINAIRVKLVARMFAVVKNNQKYQPIKE